MHCCLTIVLSGLALNGDKFSFSFISYYWSVLEMVPGVQLLIHVEGKPLNARIKDPNFKHLKEMYMYCIKIDWEKMLHVANPYFLFFRR